MKAKLPALDSAPPLHRSVARKLSDEIASGRLLVGAVLPSEHAMAEAFSVSRHTIRVALRHLAALGLIDQRQGAATRVLARHPPALYTQSMRSLNELQQYALDTRFKIHTIRDVLLDEEEAALVHAEANTRWIQIVGLRQAPATGAMICHTTVYVHARFEALLADVREATGPVYALVEARSGEEVKEAMQEITAGALPKAGARALARRQGEHALRFVRRYLDAAGQTMVCSANWHPAQNFVYCMRIQKLGP